MIAPRRQRFGEEYVVDLDVARAAIRAGYSVKMVCSQGARLLKKVEIRKAIKEGQKRVSRRIGRATEDLFIDLCRAAEEAERVGDDKVALRGLELQGKRLGRFTDKIENRVVGASAPTVVLNVAPIEADQESGPRIG